MQFPVHITIGHTRILLHSILEPLAFFIGFRYFLFLRRREGDVIDSPNRIWIFVGAVLGAFIGSRLIGGLENLPQLKAAGSVGWHFYQNKTVLGGFLGGLLGVELFKKIIGETKASGDLFVYPMILALIIGRIGCFSMGVYEETYGLPTAMPWGMYLGDSKLRQPVSLYEIGFLVLLWISFVVLEKRVVLKNGALFKLFMMGYCLFRFLLDFIKPHYTFPIGLSTIQITALLGWLYYYRYVISPEKLLAEKNESSKEIRLMSGAKVIINER